MIDLYLLSVLAFLAVLAVLIYRDRKNIEYKYIIVIKKTKIGMHFLNNVANAAPRFWKVFSTVSIFVALVVMGYTLYMFGETVKLILEQKLTTPALQLILPIPQTQPMSGPGYILIPFWFWIIVLPFILLPHELMHGVIARVEKVRVTSVGLFLFAIFPGGFVEPDEKGMKKAKIISRLRIISVGSVANFVLVVALLLCTQFLVWPSAVRNGIVITDVGTNNTLVSLGLKDGSVIQEINGKQMRPDFWGDFQYAYASLLFTGKNVTADNVRAYTSVVYLNRVLGNYEAGDSILIKVDNKFYNLTVPTATNSTNNNAAYVEPVFTINSAKNEPLFSVALPLVWWCTLIGAAVAAVNLMPIYPLDGGLMVDSILEFVVKREKVRKKIVIAVTTLVIALLVFTIIGPLIL
jgi:membrane-associated protease RseP (regulator of RpoE activity)